MIVSEGAGEFRFVNTDASSAGPTCPFATIESYDPHSEGEVLSLIARASNLEEFLERLVAGRFFVLSGPPQPSKFARL